MTAVVAAALAVLAVLDGTFAGFRASLGRTGLIDHRTEDRLGAARGAVTLLVLLAPVAVTTGADAATDTTRLPAYTDAGVAMLAVYGPYAVTALLALLAYGLLSWRKRYLAAAVILGPLTFLRPAIALTGAILAAIASRDLVVAALSGAAVVAVLAVEPTANRRWYSARPARRATENHRKAGS